VRHGCAACPLGRAPATTRGGIGSCGLRTMRPHDTSDALDLDDRHRTRSADASNSARYLGAITKQ
jgi:hypothetical protein